MSKQQNIGDFLDMVPPQDLEAERCVLGSILMVNSAIDEVAPIIQAPCFYAEAHRRIYAAIYDMYQEKRTSCVDAVTLRDELTRRGELELIGGTQYIIQLFETVPHAEHAEFYANIVREKWQQRRVIEAATETLKEAYNGHSKTENVVALAERRLSEITSNDVIDIATADTVATEMVDRMCHMMSDEKLVDGVSIPWGPLRELIDSWAETCLYILAARPSQGKTALAMEIAMHAAKTAGSVLVVSLEMPSVQLAQRLSSRLSGVSSKTIRNGLRDIDDSEKDMCGGRVIEAADNIRSLPIRFCDHRMNITQLKQIIRKECRTKNAKLIIIDYLQLIETSAHMMNANKSDQVGEITRELKLLSNELRTPIIALSQLNRGVEQREDKTPKLSDLRDSGAIEQEADVVIFLHRPESYVPGDMPGKAVLTIAKNRHGPIGTAVLDYDKTCGRFYVAEDQQQMEF